MNKGAIVRIIIWGLVALLLIGVLVFFLRTERTSWMRKTDDTRGSFGGGSAAHTAAKPDGAESPERTPNPDSTSTSASTPGADSAAAQNAVSGLSGIREIEIEWMNSSVQIVPTDSELQFYEDYSGEDKYRMSYSVDGNTLKINEFEGVSTFLSMRLPQKTLTVELPRSTFDRIDIETVSADVEVCGVQIQELDLETVSGDITLRECGVTELDVSAVSGKVEGNALTASEAGIETVSGKIDLRFESCRTLDSETVSGRMDIAVLSQLQKAELDTTSGEMFLAIPDGLAANVTWKTASGSLQNSAMGTSTVPVHADSTSGDLTIENAEKVTP